MDEKGKIPRKKSVFNEFTPFSIHEQASAQSKMNTHIMVPLSTLLGTGHFKQKDVKRELPQDIRDELDRHDITEKEWLYIKSDLSDKNKSGSSYIVAVEGSLIILRQATGQSLEVIKLSNEDIQDIGGELDKTDHFCYVFINAGKQAIKVWFYQTRTDDVLSFIETWKHQHKGTAEKSKVTHCALLKLDRIVLFGTLMLHQICDNLGNVSASGYEYIKHIIRDEDHLRKVITTYKEVTLDELYSAVSNFFSFEQKLLIFTNMADLSYRHGKEHTKEIEELKKLLVKVDFPIDIFEEILHFSRAKHSMHILNENN